MSQIQVAGNVAQTRRTGGISRLDHMGIIEVSGKDAASFLQGRTSNDVSALDIGQGQLTSLLHRKGHVLALFSLHKLASASGETRFYILSERTLVSFILQELDTYRFREQVEFKDVTDVYEMTALQGPLSSATLADVGLEFSSTEFGITESRSCLIITRSLTGEEGGIILRPRNAGEDGLNEELIRTAKRRSIVELNYDDLETLRIEAGLPRFGVEVTSEYLLPETALEQQAASYNKGCFQGQEILARVKTYGAPRQALVGICFATPVTEPIEPDSKLLINGTEQGTIKSNVFSPTRNCHVAMAYIAREYRVPGMQIDFAVESANGPVQSHKGVVTFLPLYAPESSKARAKRLYDAALAEFATGSETNAISMLREAIDCDQHFADAYESLGVILSRQEQLDEAIALMHRLAELDPQSVMAHANLSLYYMQLNEIEKAEEEKAIAMSIRMSQIAKDVVSKKKEEEERQQRIAAAQDRINMFQQVLEIDNDDLLANYGMGSALTDLGKAAEAIPYLTKAIQVKPTHTVAWLALGKAYEEMGQTDHAMRTYEQGLVSAAKRGDITPMNEMKARIEELKTTSKKQP